jgi:large subunit ribosomal protein L17
MRHKMRGRKLGRNGSHRKAMFRNMACSLIRSLRVDEDDANKPRVAGRIVTTVAKAKELRPFVEKLVTLAKKSAPHREAAEKYATSAERGTDEWRNWRSSDEWNRWNQAIAPAVAYRRRAFAILRDREAVDILFDELADRFADRPGGYTRVVRLAAVRLGDAGPQALIEFVGERDRTKQKRRAPLVADRAEGESAGAARGDEEPATAEGETQPEVSVSETAESESADDAKSEATPEGGADGDDSKQP